MRDRGGKVHLVTDITGRVGGAAARALLWRGEAVRALVSDAGAAAVWAEAGVELVEGALGDAGRLAATLDGVDGAFLVLPDPVPLSSDHTETRALVDQMASTVDAARPDRLVILSSVGADRESGAGAIGQSHLFEAAMADTAAPVAVLRAGARLEDYGAALIPAARNGEFATFLAPIDAAFPMVGTEDIGREAARLLVDGWQDCQLVELGSPTTPEDLAHAMALTLGRDVTARSIRREDWPEEMAGLGVQPDAAAPFEEMMDGFNSGRIAFGCPGAIVVPASTAPADVYARMYPI